MAVASHLARLVVRRPRLVLLVAALLAVLAAPLALRVRLDTDPVNLIPQHNEEAAAFARFVRVFSEEQLLVILVIEQVEQVLLDEARGRAREL